jgi:hypothetical protein
MRLTRYDDVEAFCLPSLPSLPCFVIHRRTNRRRALRLSHPLKEDIKIEDARQKTNREYDDSNHINTSVVLPAETGLPN